VRYCLEELHREHRFALVEFPTRGGLSFRAIQARRAGLAFADVRFLVRFDGCSALLRQQEHAWVNSVADLEQDYCERYAFEHADGRTSPNPALLEEARRLGWDVGARAVGGLVERAAGLAPAVFRQDGGGKPRRSLHPSVTSEPPLVTVSIAHYNLGRYLPETLASLAAQTYPHLEVLVIDDGSTDAESVAVLRDLQARYPQFRFLRQDNAGIGATRNHGLREARGEYFLPMDADNVARPDMVERFVTGMRRNPGVAALTCYFLAFTEATDLQRERYAYAYRPTGGPYVLASMRNVYGDANAIFRTADFRAVGGYETDRDTSCEDWEAFVKLAAAGYRIDVVPDYLFFYRHREAGFSRVTDGYRNHQRVLRQFLRSERLPPAERVLLWNALPGMQRRLEQLEEENRVLRRRSRSWRGLIARLLRALGSRAGRAEEGACLPA
jgi:glycosyltransferase involved in cell wall biosynthesis